MAATTRRSHVYVYLQVAHRITRADSDGATSCGRARLPGGRLISRRSTAWPSAPSAEPSENCENKGCSSPSPSRGTFVRESPTTRTGPPTDSPSGYMCASPGERQCASLPCRLTLRVTGDRRVCVMNGATPRTRSVTLSARTGVPGTDDPVLLGHRPAAHPLTAPPAGYRRCSDAALGPTPPHLRPAGAGRRPRHRPPRPGRRPPPSPTSPPRAPTPPSGSACCTCGTACCVSLPSAARAPRRQFSCTASPASPPTNDGAW